VAVEQRVGPVGGDQVADWAACSGSLWCDDDGAVGGRAYSREFVDTSREAEYVSRVVIPDDVRHTERG